MKKRCRQQQLNTHKAYTMKLKKLHLYPAAFPYCQNKSVTEAYGVNARRINFKKMAIIYTIHGSTVYVHRVIAASMITDL